MSVATDVPDQRVRREKLEQRGLPAVGGAVAIPAAVEIRTYVSISTVLGAPISQLHRELLRV